jgi:hypothetical protein
MIKRFIVALLLMLSLAACGTFGVSEGDVIDKAYHPARDWTEKVADYISVPRSITEMRCNSDSKGRQTCTSSTRTVWDRVFVGWHDEARHEDEYWTLTIKDGNDNAGTVRVSKIVYSEKQLGSHYKVED